MRVFVSTVSEIKVYMGPVFALKFVQETYKDNMICTWYT